MKTRVNVSGAPIEIGRTWLQIRVHVGPLFCQSSLDVLEDRQLLTATLQAIGPLTVPALQGDTMPLLADTGATDAQTFTVTSSNPDIAASIATVRSGPSEFRTPIPSIPPTNFTGTLVYQFFQNLTPNTVSEISNLTYRRLLREH